MARQEERDGTLSRDLPSTPQARAATAADIEEAAASELHEGTKHRSLAVVVHGIGDHPRGAALRSVVKDLRPLIQARLDEGVLIAASPLDNPGPAEVTFSFTCQDENQVTHFYELRFVEVWWQQAFLPPRLGPLLAGGVLALRRWFAWRGVPASSWLSFVPRLIGEAVSTLIYGVVAVLVAAVLLPLALLLSAAGYLGQWLQWSIYGSVHAAVVGRVAKHQPIIVEMIIILVSPLIIGFLVVLWLIEALVPRFALWEPVKSIHLFLVNSLTRNFGDIWSYMEQSYEASQVRVRFESIVEEQLKDLDFESVVVVAHSLGSVVAYEALTGPVLQDSIGRSNAELHFISIGSALNHVWASVSETERGRFAKPLNSEVRWLNLWSDYDPVGGRATSLAR